MLTNFEENATKLYKQYYKMLWWFSHKYKIDIADCEIAFIKCVKTYDTSKSSFSNYLWLSLKHAVYRQYRDNKAIKRQTENHICDYNIDWIGVTSHQSIWNIAKDILLPCDYDLLYKVFAMGYSQSELAPQYFVSQPYLSRRINKIVGILKSYLKDNCA